MLLTSNWLTIAGLVFLALALVGAVALIADFIYGPAVPILCAGAGAVLFAGLWFVLAGHPQEPRRDARLNFGQRYAAPDHDECRR